MEDADARLDVRRKRIRFRAWHRGITEVDLILGSYADAHVAAMDADGLTALEALLDVPDREVLGWLTGEFAVPAGEDTPLLRHIMAFHGRA